MKVLDGADKLGLSPDDQKWLQGSYLGESFKAISERKERSWPLRYASLRHSPWVVPSFVVCWAFGESHPHRRRLARCPAADQTDTRGRDAPSLFAWVLPCGSFTTPPLCKRDSEIVFIRTMGMKVAQLP